MSYESYPMHLLYDGKSTLGREKRLWGSQDCAGLLFPWKCIKAQSAFLSLNLNSTQLQWQLGLEKHTHTQTV